jgi:hypothetical protein
MVGFEKHFDRRTGEELRLGEEFGAESMVAGRYRSDAVEYRAEPTPDSANKATGPESDPAPPL